MSNPAAEGTLLVAHSILGSISEDRMLDALAPEHRQGRRVTVAVEPVRVSLSDLATLDWADVRAAQARACKSKLEPELRDHPGYRLVYYGLAPIPLALDLGYRVGGIADVAVCLQHHDSKRWEWPADVVEPPALLEVKLPQDGSRARGDVIIRVSVSHRVSPEETRDVVPEPLCEIDIGLVHPAEDAMRSPEDLEAIVRQFNSAIDAIKDRYPHVEMIHLFASVPVGLAFKLGTSLNPTIHAPVQTYQYAAQRAPRYEKAFVLQVDVAPPVRLTNEEVEQAASIRRRAAEELELLKEYGESLREQAQRQHSQLRWWERVLPPGPDWKGAFHGRIAKLKPLHETELMLSKVDVDKSEVADSFYYHDKHWELGDDLLAAIGRQLADETRSARACRMLMLHEGIHHQCHGLTSETSAQVRRFPKVLEEVDYQADVWGMLHEYAFSRQDNRNASAKREAREKPAAFFQELINTALETFWAFDSGGSTLGRIEIRRLNRYLIWYWQYLCIERCSPLPDSLPDVVAVLSERPLIEIAGPRVRVVDTRVVYLLDQPYEADAEICLLQDNWVYRPGHSAGTRVRDILDGFRERDSGRIRRGLKSVFDQFVHK